MFSYLQENLSLTVPNLRPPNRQNKARKKRRAVARFEGDVTEYIYREGFIKLLLETLDFPF